MDSHELNRDIEVKYPQARKSVPGAISHQKKEMLIKTGGDG
mgnify:CR=1 FL=1